MATAKKTTRKTAVKKKAPAKKKVAAKKAPARKKAAPKGPTLVDDEGFAIVSGELLWKYRASVAEWNEAQALLTSARLQEQQELQKELYAPLRKVRHDINQKTMGRESKTKELREVQQQIADLFGLSNLKNCAIEDNTGRIYILDSTGTQASTPATAKELKKYTKKKPAVTKAAGKRKTKE